MSDRSSWASAEQQAAGDFTDAMTKLRARADGPEGQAGFDALQEATLRFGMCELRMRRAERLQALGVRAAEADDLTASALANHERGLEALRDVGSYAKLLSSQETDPETLSRWQESSKQLRADWREQVAEADLAKDDALHVVTMMDECCDAADAEGIRGIGGYISRKLTELEEARRSEDRGTRAASFPYWKLVACALILGITLGWVLTLLRAGAPWWAFFLVALLACIMITLVALGCESRTR